MFANVVSQFPWLSWQFISLLLLYQQTFSRVFHNLHGIKGWTEHRGIIVDILKHTLKCIIIYLPSLPLYIFLKKEVSNENKTKLPLSEVHLLEESGKFLYFIFKKNNIYYDYMNRFDSLRNSMMKTRYNA